MIGKLIIPDCQHLLNYDEDAGKEYVEDIIAGDIFHIMPKWFGVPDLEHIINIVESDMEVA